MSTLRPIQLVSMHSVMRRDLYSGVTAERDMAGDTRQLAELSRASLLSEVESGCLLRPRLWPAPAFLQTNVRKPLHEARRPEMSPWMKAVTAQTDLRVAIAEAHGTGATAIKIYADLPSELVATITKEAHSQGMLVWAHATIYPATASQLVAAGVDVVSHAPLLAGTRPPDTYAASHRSPAADQEYADAFGPQFTDLLREMKKARHDS